MSSDAVISRRLKKKKEERLCTKAHFVKCLTGNVKCYVDSKQTGGLVWLKNHVCSALNVQPMDTSLLLKSDYIGHFKFTFTLVFLRHGTVVTFTTLNSESDLHLHTYPVHLCASSCRHFSRPPSTPQTPWPTALVAFLKNIDMSSALR